MALQLRFVLQSYIGGYQVAGEPVGADTLTTKLQRHPTYFGVNMEASTGKLAFLGTDKTYIVDIIEDESFKETIPIRVDVSEDAGTTWEELYHGELDLNDFEIHENHDEFGDCIVVGIRQQGIYNKLLAREDIKVNIGSNLDLGGNARSGLTLLTDTYSMVGYQFLIQSLHKVTTEYVSTYNTNPIITLAVNEDAQIFIGPAFAVYNEIADYQSRQPTAQVYTGVNLTDYGDDNDALLILNEITDPTTVTFKAGNPGEESGSYIEVQWGTSRDEMTLHVERASGPDNITSATAKLRLMHKDVGFDERVIKTITMGIDNVSGPAPFAYCPPTAVQFSDEEFDALLLGAGFEDKFFLSWTVEITPNNNNTYDVYYNQLLDPLYPENTDRIHISMSSKPAGYDVIGKSVHDVGLSIACQIGEKDAALYSEYFGNYASSVHTYASNGNGSWNILTSGKKLRGGGGGVYVSFKEWFDGLNAIYNIGMHIENEGGNISDDRLRVEEKKYFFQTGSPSVTLGAIDNVTKKRASDLMFSSVEIGFEKFTIDTFVSADIISGSKEYASILGDYGERLILKCPFIADNSTIEITRRVADVADVRYKHDDDVFIIAMNRDEGASPDVSMYENETDENFSDTPANYIALDTAYNLRHTPGRMFLRWGNILNTGLVNDAGEFWRPQNFKGGNDWISTMTSVNEGDFENNSFDETDNIQWDYGSSPTEQTPIFTPWAYEFQYPLTFQEYKTIRDNKRQTIEITYEGATIEVFIWSIEYNPMDPASTRFVCIGANV